MNRTEDDDFKDEGEITRLEVIEKTGRKYVHWNCKLRQSIQDNGRTLKIFVEEKRSD